MEFTFFPFQRKEKGNLWKNSLHIDTPLEIGANKIHALTERHEVKDVYDLYYIHDSRISRSPKTHESY